MRIRAIALPVMLALRQRVTGRARLDAARTDERVAQTGLAGLIVLFVAAVIYAALDGAGPRRDDLLVRIFLALFVTPVTLTLIPLVSPVGRSAPSLPAEWPLSAAQRGLSDLSYALTGFWSAFYLAVVAAVILASPSGSVTPGIPAGLAAAVTVVTTCALTRFLMEWLLPRVAQVVLALTVVAILSLFVAGQAESLTIWRVVPTLVIADVFRETLSPAARWRATLVLTVQATAFVAAYLLAFRAGHWRWRESQERSRFSRSANAIARFQPMAHLLSPRAAVRAVFVQQLTYLVRAPRVWFLLPYGPIFGLIFLRQLAPDSSPAFQAFFLTMWISGGSCLLFYNLFAFDGRGMAQWQQAPVSERDLIVGKDLATLVSAVPSAALCMTLVTWQTGWDLRLGLAGVLLMAYLLAVHAAIGNFASVAFPAPLRLRSMTRSALSGPGALLLLMTLAISTAVAGLAWWLAAGSGGLAILGVQGLLLFGVWPITRYLLGSAARHLSRNRERLAAAVMEWSGA